MQKGRNLDIVLIGDSEGVDTETFLKEFVSINSAISLPTSNTT